MSKILKYYKPPTHYPDSSKHGHAFGVKEVDRKRGGYRGLWVEVPRFDLGAGFSEKFQKRIFSFLQGLLEDNPDKFFLTEGVVPERFFTFSRRTPFL